MWEHITAEGIAAAIASIAAILGGNVWVTSALIDRKLTALNGIYVRANECLIRTAGAQQDVQETRLEGRAACLAAAGRDERTQDRINELSMMIATAILGNETIVQKIDTLLARK